MVKERKVDENEAMSIMKTDKTFKPPMLFQQDSEGAGGKDPAELIEDQS